MLNTVCTNWRQIIENYKTDNKKIKHDNFSKIEEEIKTQRKMGGDFVKTFPPEDKVLRCFQYFDFENTKVVLVGQDPYHGEGEATGLCFHVNSETPVPPSLKNIYKKFDNVPNLESWAHQGVLMLNTALTVIQKQPMSNVSIWNGFTSYILKFISDNSIKPIIFIAWGREAQNLVNKNVDLNKHIMVMCSHPSPLGANKSSANCPSFNEFNTFDEVNKILLSQNETPINW